jgi:hypothetical protein
LRGLRRETGCSYIHPYHRIATRLCISATPGREPEVELALV